MKIFISFIISGLILIFLLYFGPLSITNKCTLIVDKKEFSILSDHKYHYVISTGHLLDKIYIHSNDEYNVGDTLMLIKKQ